ncbi:MAG: YdcF family protein [Longicatena sp.]
MLGWRITTTHICRPMIVVLIILFVIHAFLWYAFRGNHTHKDKHFSVCLVLGSPTLADGQVSSIQKRRMDKALKNYKEHKVSKIIVSGGAVHNKYIEATTLKYYAISQGCNETDIFLESQSMNTYDNFRFTKELCQTNKFTSILIITSPAHTPRANFFARKFFTDYKVVKSNPYDSLKHYAREYIAMWNTLRIEYLNKTK